VGRRGSRIRRCVLLTTTEAQRSDRDQHQRREIGAMSFQHFSSPLTHAAKSKMVRSSVRLTFAATARHVARTILVGAKKRPASMNALGHARLRRIEAISGSLWIPRNLMC